MSILKDLPALREMERAARDDDYLDAQDYWQAIIDAAPAMLEVLACFREGDAKRLGTVLFVEEDAAKFVAGFGKISPESQSIINMLKRLQKAAELMEAECDGKNDDGN